MIKKKGKVLLSAGITLICAFLLTFAFSSGSFAYADSTTQKGTYDDAGANHANLLLLVRFAGDTVGDGATGYNVIKAPAYQQNNIKTEWQYLDRELNESNLNAYVKQSTREYVTYSSGGKTNLYTYLPQTNTDWTVDYITLGDISQYVSNDKYDDAKLLQDAIDQFNARFNFNGKLADKDNNGYADCVTLLIQIPKGWSGSYRSHASSAGNAAAGNLTVGNTNGVGLDKYLAISTTSLGAGSGVFAHEFLHSVGARDYYREAAGGEGGATDGIEFPVGIWDIMSSSDAKTTPLAITRQDCNWGNIQFEQIPAAGESKEYTLSVWADAANNPNKRQAVAFKTPFSNSEYFVVEYREKGNLYLNWDYKIPGSGLIVYRVNPAYYEEGNFLSNDYVYLFRQGERGLTDSYSANVYVPSQLSTTGVSEFGSIDLTKTITDNALVYSSGQNSGLKLTVLRNGNGEATFKLEAADYAGMSFWDTSANPDGTTPFDTTKAGNVIMANDGQSIFMVAGSGTVDEPIEVAKWNGTSWTPFPKLGSRLSQPSAAVVNGRLYVSGVAPDGTYSVCSIGVDGAGQWSTPTAVSRNQINEGGLFSVNGNLYATTSDGSQAKVYALNGGTFSQVGSTVSGSYLTKPTVVSVGSQVGLVVSDFFGGGTKFYALNGGAFTQKGSTPFKSGVISPVVKDGTTYVMLASNNQGVAPHFVRLNADGSVAEEKTINALGTYVNPGNIAIQGDNVLFAGSLDGRLEVLSSPISDLGTWTRVGEAVLAPAVLGTVAVVGDTIYAATTSGNRPYLKNMASPTAQTYTVKYVFTGVPNGFAVTPPTDTTHYNTEDAARAAKKDEPTVGTVQRGSKDGQAGTFTFKGYDNGTTDAGVITFTGTWDFVADDYTVKYAFTGVPVDFALAVPTDDAHYNTEDAARAAKKDEPTVGTVQRGSKDGQAGTFTFKGYDNGTVDAGVITFTGTWDFVADDYTVKYAFTGVPVDFALAVPTDDAHYNTEDAARAAKKDEPAVGTVQRGSKDGQQGTFTFKGYDAGVTQNNVITFTGTWDFAADDFTVKYVFTGVPADFAVVAPTDDAHYNTENEARASKKSEPAVGTTQRGELNGKQGTFTFKGYDAGMTSAGVVTFTGTWDFAADDFTVKYVFADVPNDFAITAPTDTTHYNTEDAARAAKKDEPAVGTVQRGSKDGQQGTFTFKGYDAGVTQNNVITFTGTWDFAADDFTVKYVFTGVPADFAVVAPTDDAHYNTENEARASKKSEPAVGTTQRGELNGKQGTFTFKGYDAGMTSAGVVTFTGTWDFAADDFTVKYVFSDVPNDFAITAPTDTTHYNTEDAARAAKKDEPAVGTVQRGSKDGQQGTFTFKGYDAGVTQNNVITFTGTWDFAADDFTVKYVFTGVPADFAVVAPTDDAHYNTENEARASKKSEPAVGTTQRGELNGKQGTFTFKGYDAGMTSAGVVTFTGTWDFAADDFTVKYVFSDVPNDFAITAPTDTTHYNTEDAARNSKKDEPAVGTVQRGSKDGQAGTFTFKGYDAGVTQNNVITFTGTWDFAADDFTVKYVFTGVPADFAVVAPTDDAHYNTENEARASKKSEPAVGTTQRGELNGKQGTFTFKGYDAGMTSAGVVTFTGTWDFAADDFTVKYVFSDVPNDFAITAPTDTTHYNTEDAARAAKKDEPAVGTVQRGSKDGQQGTFTFKGYDAGVTQNNVITFTGTWDFAADDFTVKYVFTGVPADFAVVAPTDDAHYNTENEARASKKSEPAVGTTQRGELNGQQGTFTFKGYDAGMTSAGVVTFTGTWDFAADDFTVKYVFADVPNDFAITAPTDTTHYNTEDAARAAKKDEPTVGTVQRGSKDGQAGTFTFKGYDNGTTDAGVITFTGTWDFAADDYTVKYAFTGVPVDFALAVPTDDARYNTEDAARAAKKDEPAVGTVQRGSKDGQQGTFTFKGYDAGVTQNNVITFTGTWDFAADDYTVKYAFTGVPVDFALAVPTDDAHYNTENEARASKKSEPAVGTTQRGELNGKQGTFTFKGYDNGTVDAGVVIFTGTWEFTADTPTQGTYTKSFYIQDANTGEFSLESSLKYVGSVGANVTLDAPDRKSEHLILDESNPNSVLSGQITDTTSGAAELSLMGYYALETFDVSFDTKGATSAAIPSKEARFGQTITLPDAPTLSGKVFVGWSNGSTTYNAKSPFVVNAPTKFIAVWDNDPISQTQSYTVEYYEEDLNGSYKLIRSETINSTLGENVSIKPQTRDHFTVDAAQSELSGKVSADPKPLVLKVCYKRESYNVVLNDGVNPSVTETIKYGKSIILPSPSTRSAFVFLGWEDSNGVVYAPDSVLSPKANLSLTGKWQPLFILAFVSSDAAVALDPSRYPEATVAEGATYVLPVAPTAPAGYSFEGWLVGSEVKKPGDNIVVSASQTITAQWKKNPSGGTSSGETPSGEKPTTPGQGSGEDSAQESGSGEIGESQVISTSETKPSQQSKDVPATADSAATGDSIPPATTLLLAALVSLLGAGVSVVLVRKHSK